jgi:hypothetical protein
VREKGIKILNKEEIEGMRVVCRVSRRDFHVVTHFASSHQTRGVVDFPLLVVVVSTPC